MAEEGATLLVQLRRDGRPVLLDDLSGAIRRFQGAMNELAANLSTNLSRGKKPLVGFEILEAEVGSLGLTLRAVPDPSLEVSALRLLRVFVEDMEDIQHERFRDDLSASLAEKYRRLVEYIGKHDLTAEIVVDQEPIVIDDAFQRSFSAAFKERTAAETELVGYLDEIRAHAEPFDFSLYPKLPGFAKIRCQFPSEMLDTVRSLLKSIVRVKGRATYGPISLYPNRIDLTEAPRLATYSKDWLLSQVGTLKQLRPGESVVDYLSQNRKEIVFDD